MAEYDKVLRATVAHNFSPRALRTTLEQPPPVQFARTLRNELGRLARLDVVEDESFGLDQSSV